MCRTKTQDVFKLEVLEKVIEDESSRTKTQDVFKSQLKKRHIMII